MKNHLPNILKGLAMGIAEVIPGVSGGTIAFITGIYERLLNAINSFSPALFGTLKKDGFKGLWKAIDGTFLFALIVGMVGGILVGVIGVSYLLEEYPPLIWAFFFGLIIASAIYIGRQIDKWSAREIILLILGAVVAYMITTVAPVEWSRSLPVVFIAGAIAISALILPGISGSFMLLLMGMYYFIVTQTLKVGVLENQDPQAFLTMGVFALGCLTGLLTVARLLSWTFKNYRYPTLAVLTGFMLGSLNKIWPWRTPVEAMNEAGEIITDSAVILADKEMKILREIKELPWDYSSGDSLFMGALLMLVLGFVSVFAMERLGGKD